MNIFIKQNPFSFWFCTEIAILRTGAPAKRQTLPLLPLRPSPKKGDDHETVCKENGANVLVAGSAYFKAADRASFVKTIQA